MDLMYGDQDQSEESKGGHPPDKGVPMATTKKPRVFTASEKAAILAESDASTVAAVAKLRGMSAQTIYAWRAAKKKRRTAKRAAKKAAKAGATITRAAETASNGKAKSRAASLDLAHAQLTEAHSTVSKIRAAFREVFGVDA